MSQMPLFTDEDLMKDQPQEAMPADDMAEALQKEREARDLAILERDKARKECEYQKNRASQLLKDLRKERELRVAAQQKKSIAAPIALFISAAVLAFLVILATNSMLVAAQLGDPLAAFLIGCCAFFAGMVWDRCEATEKLRGGKANGNGGLQNAD